MSQPDQKPSAHESQDSLTLTPLRSAGRIRESGHEAILGSLVRALLAAQTPAALLAIFADHIQPLVAHDSLAFTATAEQTIVLGRPGVHSCHYTLSFGDRGLGHLTATRATPFSEEELARLEALLGILCYSLDHLPRNASGNPR